MRNRWIVVHICKHPIHGWIGWLLHLAFGPAQIIDGIIRTVTFGKIGTTLVLEITRLSALSSLKYFKKLRDSEARNSLSKVQ